jgi:type VI secretion system protein ImpB
MDGKSGAEQLIAKALQDKTLLSALTSAPKPEDKPANSGTEEQSNG